MKKEIEEMEHIAAQEHFPECKKCQDLVDEAIILALQQERERIIREIEKMKKEIYNKDEIGKVGTHAIASNQNDGYNQAIEDIIETLNQ